MSPSAIEAIKAVSQMWLQRARRALARPKRHLVFVNDAGWHDVTDDSRHVDAAAWCAAHPGTDLELRLSGTLVHTLVCDAALPLRDEEAVRAYVRHQCEHYHGPVGRDWALAVWCAGEQWGGCALHGLDVAAIDRVAEAHQVRLRSVQPWWSPALECAAHHDVTLAARERHALALIEGPMVGWVSIADGRVVSVEQRYAIGNGAADLAQRLTELSARDGLSEPPVAMGYGLSEAADPEAGPLPAQVLGSLHGERPASACLRGLPIDGPRP